MGGLVLKECKGTMLAFCGGSWRKRHKFFLSQAGEGSQVREIVLGGREMGRKTGNMIPVKLIIEIVNADINQEAEWSVGAGSGFCVADDRTRWLHVPAPGLG